MEQAIMNEWKHGNINYSFAGVGYLAQIDADGSESIIYVEYDELPHLISLLQTKWNEKMNKVNEAEDRERLVNTLSMQSQQILNQMQEIEFLKRQNSILIDIVDRLSRDKDARI